MSLAAAVGGRPRSLRRPRPVGSLVGVIAALAVLLGTLFVAGGQIAALARQAGHPTQIAQVVSCPGLDGGPCLVRVDRGDSSAVLRLADSTLVFAQAGDELPVAIADSTTAEPAGARPWLAAAACLLLVAWSVGAGVRWGRRLIDERTPEVRSPADAGARTLPDQERCAA